MSTVHIRPASQRTIRGLPKAQWAVDLYGMSDRWTNTYTYEADDADSAVAKYFRLGGTADGLPPALKAYAEGHTASKNGE